MKSFKLIKNIIYNVINYNFKFLFALSIINITVLRLVLYHLYTVLCGVVVRALDWITTILGSNPLKPSKFLFLTFVF